MKNNRTPLPTPLDRNSPDRHLALAPGTGDQEGTPLLRRRPLSLNLLGRTPEPGQVKTRLIPLLGPRGAARAHERLLSHVATVARSWCQEAPGREFLLWCTPTCDHPSFDTIADPGRRRLQGNGDLGQRLAAIVSTQLQSHRAILLLGGDAASIAPPLLDQVEASLDNHDAVLVPAEDGGYLLLALTRDHPQLFVDIPWGTETVAENTRKRLVTLGFSWTETTIGWDVDRPEDWNRFENMPHRSS
ncbi:MAG: TIGR04282 family arsenosugar biosynthesis glycosyltransferase [Magnetococcales bacterium]|nr:TIGR04282 family arsenosugar biosynthesis glycosyltransferase [Magnetococcales bacterium]